MKLSKVEKIKNLLDKAIEKESDSFSKMAELLRNRETFQSAECGRALAEYRKISKQTERLTLRLIRAERRELQKEFDDRELAIHLAHNAQMEESLIEEQKALLNLR